MTDGAHDRKAGRPAFTSRPAGERGQTLVEFALIVMLLAVILFGIMEFGRAWMYNNALTNGVRAGARFASTYPLNQTGFNSEVSAYTFSQITSAIPNNNVTVAVNPNLGTLTNRTTVSVTVTCDFDILTGSIIPFFSGTKQLRRQATMMHE